MRSKIKLFGVVLGVSAFAFSALALAQEKKPTGETKPAAKPVDAKAADPKTADKAGAKPAAGQPSPEEMAKMMAAGKPGEAHDKLKPMTGKWTYVTKWRMSPDQPWEESTGKAEFKWINGGRFLTQDIKGNPSPNDAMMGGPFEGFGITGYDNTSKKYYNIWTDNMTTGMMTSEGTADGSGKVFTYESEYNCPMRGPNQHSKTVMKIEGDDKMVFQMFDKGPDGKEFANLEVNYTRAK
jgi:hypothetical protein